jgi:hypothetical protein
MSKEIEPRIVRLTLTIHAVRERPEKDYRIISEVVAACNKALKKRWNKDLEVFCDHLRIEDLPQASAERGTA